MRGWRIEDSPNLAQRRKVARGILGGLASLREISERQLRIMLATLSLIRREFSAYFLSPIAYVVLAVFLAVTGYLFARTLAQLTAVGPQGIEFPMQMMLGLGDLQTLRGVLAFLAFWLVFLITPPLLTMRLFAEERSSGTLEM